LSQKAKNFGVMVAGGAAILFLMFAWEVSTAGYFPWELKQGRGFTKQELRDCRAKSNLYVEATRDPRTGHWKADRGRLEQGPGRSTELNRLWLWEVKGGLKWQADAYVPVCQTQITGTGPGLPQYPKADHQIGIVRPPANATKVVVRAYIPDKPPGSGTHR
jgi:hypothetical protein